MDTLEVLTGAPKLFQKLSIVKELVQNQGSSLAASLDPQAERWKPLC